MDNIVQWLREIFLEPSITQSIVILCVVSALGLELGKIKIAKISLGITFVFFVGILFSHFGVVCDPQMLSFAQSFGLVIFVYSLGLQVGPSFFPSLKKGGIAFNLISLGLVLISLLLCLLLYFTVGVSMPNLMGILAGATTNTPALAASQSTLQQLDPNSAKSIAEMALACAVTYPFGVVGVILALIALKRLAPTKQQEQADEAQKAYISEFEVVNPALDGMSIKALAQLSETDFVITRVWQDGKVHVAHSETKIQLGDKVLCVADKAELPRLEILFGKREEKDWNSPDIDWNEVGEELTSRRIVISKAALNGTKLGELNLRKLHGVNISRIDRAGIELLPSRDLHLQLGDRLTVVGEKQAVNRVAELLGDEIKQLDQPHLTTLFGGIVLGCILGLVPFFLPGISMPIKLGLAGGPIIVGILMGAFGPRFRLTTYVTNSANLLLQRIGIIIYLAGLGLSSGALFFETIIHGDGILWVGFGVLITLLPTLLIGWVSLKLLKLRYDHTAGLICGSMANPMALDYINGVISGEKASVSYATVYPLSMFLRIIVAQIMIMLFL